jgi:hypothetical protein
MCVFLPVFFTHMSVYPWNRFWVKRGGVLHTVYRQFPAYYPSGSVYFDQNAFQLAELEELPLLILLGEPGIGKSVVIEQAFADNKNSFKIYSRLSKHTSAKDIVEEWENDHIFKHFLERLRIAFVGNPGKCLFRHPLVACMLGGCSTVSTLIVGSQFVFHRAGTDHAGSGPSPPRPRKRYGR